MRSLDPGFDEFAGAHTHGLLGLAHAQPGDPAAYARLVMVRLNIDRARRLLAPTDRRLETPLATPASDQPPPWEMLLV